MPVVNNENEHYEGKRLCKVVDNGENLDDLEEAITKIETFKNNEKYLGKTIELYSAYILKIRGNKETFVFLLGCHLVFMLCYI